MCYPNDFPLKKQSNFNVGALIIVDCCYLAGGGKTYTMVGQPVSSFAKLINFDKDQDKFDRDQDKFDGYTNKRLILVGQSRNNGSGAQPTVSSYGGVD